MKVVVVQPISLAIVSMALAGCASGPAPWTDAEIAAGPHAQLEIVSAESGQSFTGLYYGVEKCTEPNAGGSSGPGTTRSISMRAERPLVVTAMTIRLGGGKVGTCTSLAQFTPVQNHRYEAHMVTSTEVCGLAITDRTDASSGAGMPVSLTYRWPDVSILAGGACKPISGAQ
jgi:hypothetical protein